MGFRFRKSFNLGGGFRTTFSKSGAGFSWGTKGFRVTKKARGGTRTTFSIPGTGISHVSDKAGGSGCVTILIVWPLKLCIILPITHLIPIFKNKVQKNKEIQSQEE